MMGAQHDGAANAKQYGANPGNPLSLWRCFSACAPVSAQEPATPAAVSPHARLMAARSIYIQSAPASIPYDIIGDAFQGWGRYQVADNPAAADLIVSIVAPPPNPGASVGRQPPKTAPRLSDDVTQIRLLILDAHDRAVLWSGSEQPKPALKREAVAKINWSMPRCASSAASATSSNPSPRPSRGVLHRDAQAIP